MDKNFAGSDKSVTIPTGTVSYLTPGDRFTGYSSLTRLEREASVLARPLMHPVELEMLEAELENQGFLSAPDPRFRLSFRLAYECSAFRWRARCYGVSGLPLEFRVNLPRFLLQCANHAAVNNTDLAPIDGREMCYLDRFAGYLLGRTITPRNLYDQGMNLVLRVLANPAHQPPNTGRSAVDVVIPTTKFEFLKLIAPHRRRLTGSRTNLYQPIS